MKNLSGMAYGKRSVMMPGTFLMNRMDSVYSIKMNGTLIKEEGMKFNAVDSFRSDLHAILRDTQKEYRQIEP